MFRIGEFSKIAQVSGRLLRYYDEIDLLRPAHIDAETGYRYYSAEQLPRLNRILALKDLGLSLDQISRLLNDDISAAEIRGMLTMQKAQIEQTLRADLTRLQQVELRLSQIEQEGHPWTPDVILKSAPPIPILSYRTQDASWEDSYPLMDAIFRRALPAGGTKIGLPLFILHSEEMEEDLMDIEMGVQLVQVGTRPWSLTAETDQGERHYRLTPRILPAEPLMATLVHTGWDDGVKSYNLLGQWIEENGYQINGPGREIILSYQWPEYTQGTVFEIQFPVTEAVHS